MIIRFVIYLIIKLLQFRTSSEEHIFRYRFIESMISQCCVTIIFFFSPLIGDRWSENNLKNWNELRCECGEKSKTNYFQLLHIQWHKRVDERGVHNCSLNLIHSLKLSILPTRYLFVFAIYREEKTKWRNLPAFAGMFAIAVLFVATSFAYRCRVNCKRNQEI